MNTASTPPAPCKYPASARPPSCNISDTYENQHERSELFAPPKTRDIVFLVHKLETRNNILNDLSMQIKLLKPAETRTS